MPRKLKHSLTTKMILETDVMLKHVGINLNFIDRPDLKHIDSSVIYLPYRVCEDCYTLFETMNDVKNCQISIANFFKVPVDPINFGVEIYAKDNCQEKKEEIKSYNALLNSLRLSPNEKEMFENNKVNVDKESADKFSRLFEHLDKVGSEYPKEQKGEKEKKNFLFRFLVMFTDILWNENIPIPDKELYLVFFIFGNWYKMKITEYYQEIDYFNINFFKMFYIICDETHGFVEYIDKNRQFLVKIGYFNEDPKRKKELELIKIFKKDITIEDTYMCNNYEEFVPFCSVELSLNAVRYADKYRNTLNGLLFKEDKPHYVGKLRCVIRVNKEKQIDVEKLNYRKHHNVRFICFFLLFHNYYASNKIFICLFIFILKL